MSTRALLPCLLSRIGDVAMLPALDRRNVSTAVWGFRVCVTVVKRHRIPAACNRFGLGLNTAETSVERLRHIDRTRFIRVRFRRRFDAMNVIVLRAQPRRWHRLF